MFEARTTTRQSWVGVEDKAAIGPAEAHVPCPDALDAEAAFVNQAMVIGAELDQVLQRGRTASRPVVDVVSMEESRVGAAGEPAAVISAAQSATECG
jgi:hypothetical protein